MTDNTVFWDKKIDKEEVRTILKDEKNPRFLEFAALLLSRANKPKEIFNQYLDKIIFCRNWRKIKRQMRTNKWSDNKIIFWDEIYKVVLQEVDKKKLKIPKEKPEIQNIEIKHIGEVIKKARIENGLTQAQLAKKAKLSQQTISFVEKGYTNISFKTIKKIVDIIGLRIYIDKIDRNSLTPPTYSLSS
ncbi:MAG: helix-turn-helix transcriptional regulator [bacterium]|nr:helix-turn-helix transcriptional regulator [bacterium]